MVVSKALGYIIAIYNDVILLMEIDDNIFDEGATYKIWSGMN